uniref:Uncharacterized protein n=1 Tax=Ananas comosus var. bracteatus TaxID=296719 RepID=A0A6V7NZU4_ANACO|nr:unnamed protein product [Ananas comosus var. bracteatus]
MNYTPGTTAANNASPQARPEATPCNIFDPTAHCHRIEGGDAALLFSALYLVAIGSAGIKASLPVHCADQFDDTDPKEAVQMSSFFNWLLLSLCVGGAISLTLLVWVQNNKGWDKGFAVSTGSMFLAFVVFLVGVPWYRIPVVGGKNALLEIGQVYVAAFRNRKLILPGNPEELYEISRMKGSAEAEEFVPHRDQFRSDLMYLSCVYQTCTQVSGQSGNPSTNGSSCRRRRQPTAASVEVLPGDASGAREDGAGMLPIFGCAIFMSTCLAQLQTFSIQQGTTMDTRILADHVKLPPATLPIIPISFMIIIIPLYDRVFVPFARRITGHRTGITYLQRIGVGLVLSCLSMATAALVETKRKKVAESHGMLDAIPVLQPLPISCLWLSLQYFIFGIADMFTYVGLLEFFYSQAPTPLKSVSISFLWCSMSVGYFLSTILVQVVNAATKNNTRSGGWLHGNNINRNHLNLFYWLLCVLSFLNFLNYLFWANWYKYRPQDKDDPSEDEKA